jgi:hypothetical protein
VKVELRLSGFDRAIRTLAEQEREMADEAALRVDMKGAVQPIADSAKSIVRVLTGKTRDDIAVRDVPSEAGRVVVAIGGSRGKGGRAFVLNFLELFGVGKAKTKYPALKPAYDGDGGAWMSRLAERVRRRLKGAA